jgi:hypothetical protein
VVDIELFELVFECYLMMFVIILLVYGLDFIEHNPHLPLRPVPQLFKPLSTRQLPQLNPNIADPKPASPNNRLQIHKIIPHIFILRLEQVLNLSKRQQMMRIRMILGEEDTFVEVGEGGGLFGGFAGLGVRVVGDVAGEEETLDLEEV